MSDAIPPGPHLQHWGDVNIVPDIIHAEELSGFGLKKTTLRGREGYREHSLSKEKVGFRGSLGVRPGIDIDSHDDLSASCLIQIHVSSDAFIDSDGGSLQLKWVFTRKNKEEEFDRFEGVTFSFHGDLSIDSPLLPYALKLMERIRERWPTPKEE